MNLTQSLQGAETFLTAYPWVIYAFIAWSLAWKAVALWKSARLSHKLWFGIMLVANTVGILEIVYIFFVARKYTVETKTESTPAASNE